MKLRENCKVDYNSKFGREKKKKSNTAKINTLSGKVKRKPITT